MLMNYIKTDATYNLYILNHANDSEEVLAYRAYCLLKEIDANISKSGFIDLKTADKAFRMFLGKNHGVDSVSRLLETKKYWVKQRKGLRLTSWYNLQKHLKDVSIGKNDGDKTFSEWAKIPVTALNKKSTFLAYIYAAWLDGKIISRENITAITGLPKSTQIRYEKKSNSNKQFVFLKLTEEEANDEITNNRLNTQSLVHLENDHLYFQAGNSYESPSTKTHYKKSKNGYKTRIRLADKKRGKINPFQGAIRYLDDRYKKVFGHTKEGKELGKIYVDFHKRIPSLPTFELTNETWANGLVFRMAKYTAFAL